MEGSRSQRGRKRRGRPPLFRKRHPPVGATPGTLVLSPGDPKAVIRVVSYNVESIEEKTIAGVSELESYLKRGSMTWIDIQGMCDEASLHALRDMFSIHPLALEDVVNAPQRPKSESFDDNHLFITRLPRISDSGEVSAEQLGIIAGANYVISFRESADALIEAVKSRIRRTGSRLRARGSDYLSYAIIDAVIDAYYPLAEALGERIEWLEDELIVRPQDWMIVEIHKLRRDLLTVRRAVWPQREAISAVIRDECPLISQDVQVFFRDCYDHCVQAMDVLDCYRELASGLQELYLSSVSHRTNEVMKVLTIMASVFIPLTFIAGIYGMNFEFMPELQRPWAYPLVLGLMAATAMGMLLFFIRRGWLTPAGKPRRNRIQDESTRNAKIE